MSHLEIIWDLSSSDVEPSKYSIVAFDNQHCYDDNVLIIKKIDRRLWDDYQSRGSILCNMNNINNVNVFKHS